MTEKKRGRPLQTPEEWLKDDQAQIRWVWDYLEKNQMGWERPFVEITREVVLPQLVSLAGSGERGRKTFQDMKGGWREASLLLKGHRRLSLCLGKDTYLQLGRLAKKRPHAAVIQELIERGFEFEEGERKHRREELTEAKNQLQRRWPKTSSGAEVLKLQREITDLNNNLAGKEELILSLTAENRRLRALQDQPPTSSSKEDAPQTPSLLHEAIQAPYQVIEAPNLPATSDTPSPPPVDKPLTPTADLTPLLADETDTTSATLGASTEGKVMPPLQHPATAITLGAIHTAPLPVETARDNQLLKVETEEGSNTAEPEPPSIPPAEQAPPVSTEDSLPELSEEAFITRLKGLDPKAHWFWGMPTMKALATFFDTAIGYTPSDFIKDMAKQACINAGGATLQNRHAIIEVKQAIPPVGAPSGATQREEAMSPESASDARALFKDIPWSTKQIQQAHQLIPPHRQLNEFQTSNDLQKLAELCNRQMDFQAFVGELVIATCTNAFAFWRQNPGIDISKLSVRDYANPRHL